MVQSASDRGKALDRQFSDGLGKVQHFSPTVSAKGQSRYLCLANREKKQVKLTTSQQDIQCPAEHIFRGVEKGAMTQTEVRGAAYLVPGPPANFEVWQFLQTLDEILFTNIDITGSVLAFIFINLASNMPFQEALRAEVRARKSQASYTATEYIAQQNSLLHCVTLESPRISPALGKFDMPYKPNDCVIG